MMQDSSARWTFTSNPRGAKTPRSLLALPVLLIVWNLTGCGGKPSVHTSTDQPAPTLLVEVTAAVGLDDTTPHWPDGHYFTPSIGSGAIALLDYDNDGDLDLYHVRRGPPDTYPRIFQNAAPNRLYQQQPDGTLVDVTERTGLGDPGFGTAVAVGDVNQDGHLDVYVSNYGPDHFYLANGDGTFTDATQSAGLAHDQPWTTSAGFFDYDRDGDLDLYVCRFGIYEPQRECRNAKGQRDCCGPASFDGICDSLYRNDGDGRFTDVTRAARLDVPLRAWGVLFADLNGDDWPDIYVTNDEDPNSLWINRKDGSFVNEGLQRGVAVNGAGWREASMGITVGDIDGDGGLDLLMTHINHETNTLYTTIGDGTYRDASSRSKIGIASLPMTGWGCAFFDYDLDTDLDLAISQGRIMIQPVLPGAKLGPFWNRYAEPNVLMENDGKGIFSDVSRLAGRYAQRVEISYSLAVGDLDNDGDLDLVVGNADNSLRVYRNDAPPASRHWLVVDPRVGPRHAYGAKVTVVANGRRWVRFAHPTYSYAVSNDPRAHFGLGEIDRIDAIEIIWPDGAHQRIPSPAVDQILVVRQGE